MSLLYEADYVVYILMRLPLISHATTRKQVVGTSNA